MSGARNVVIVVAVLGLAVAMMMWIRDGRMAQSRQRTTAMAQLEAWFETIRPELVSILEESFPDAWATGRSWEPANSERGEVFSIQLNATRSEPPGAFDTQFSTIIGDDGGPGPIRIEFHSTLGPAEQALEERWLAILEGTGVSVHRP